MTATNDSIMKADRRGRLRYSPEQRTALVEAYQASGLSGPRFASLHGVNYQTLASWLLKRKRTNSSGLPGCGTPHRISLIPAEIDGSSAVGTILPLEILLPGGSRLPVTAPSQVPLVATLIHELERKRPC